MPPKVKIIQYEKKKPYTFYADFNSNWGNPFDFENASGEYKAASLEESVDWFRKWLRGELFNDYKQKERIWLLNNVHHFEGKTIATDHPEYVQVLVEMMEPDFVVPKFKLSDWEKPKQSKKKTEKKLEMKELF